MSLLRRCLPDREAWLEARKEQGIGASEAAAICGFSKWQTRTELWEIKTGRRQRKDISSKDYVERGHTTEDAVRNFYAALHPEYEIEHHPYDILYFSERSWLFATLDGEITDEGHDRRGILEVKTSAPNSKAAWSEWDEQIPQAYYCQCLHQLLATGWDFVVLQAALWHHNGDITLKDAYVIERSEHEADIAWVLEQETEFWDSVQTGKRPGVPIRF